MAKVSSKELLPGMVLADNVSTPHLNKILDKGTILTDKDIAKLIFYSIPEVEIEEDAIDKMLADGSDPSGLTAHERIKQSNTFKEFKIDFENCAQKFEEDINDLISDSASFDKEKMLAPVYSLLKKGQTASNVFNMLHVLRNYDDATYTHSINVALTSNILAQWLKWNEEEIETATLSGLFHDIGKVSIPDSIITKPTKLTEQEFSIVMTHPQRGYDALKNLDISAHIKNAALMHHERSDGTGYPSGLTSPQIDRFAKLVSITDVYDAMTSLRHYRGPMCPFIAIAMLEEEGFQKYDPEMVLCFLQNIVNSYILNTVKLNTGEVGEIVFINKTFLSKPTVKIGENYIDLSKCNNVYIAEIL
ncbi:HD-GYP domain-containing protein [Butyrivibrio sp. YAB3001]|uniref:HD-GYP domain-containing protein n=1 Tax=Butyrivibrio sp. YAB3001 TaxID=1520812 RepID=UPI0008F67205|nr:HD-GYP domain-containing protein [Butyrivibrio sp. YAB3001]SFC78344.1 HDIG domain-containing protein [Butyrivibrio sp. YAB3001]